jgi:hypothetical protein
MWLVRRVMVLTLVLAVLCAGTVMVARANRMPSRLQALGFGVCSGEPCWQGLKAGMEWNGTKGRRMIDDGAGPFFEITYGFSSDTPLIGTLYVKQVREHPQPMTVGEIIVFYGLPCYILNFGNVLYMMYPTMVVETYLGSASPVYVSPNTTIVNLYMFVSAPDRCVNRTQFSSWHGFTSYSVVEPR